MPEAKPEISVVISTYNRSSMLRGTIASILQQKGDTQFELIVVDNNCTDDTAAVIDSFAKQSPLVRYILERQQGVSFGRNAGIAAAQADIIAFTDDDVVPDPRWVEQIRNVFASKPDFGCIGGKVLPLWPKDPPAWLTREHWTPLALLDYGEGQEIGLKNRKCLITANMAVRRKVFDQIGTFTPVYQKTIGSTCSIEDREIQERYWRAGGRCWFDPSLVVHADIQPERLEKLYHRKWHYSHGRLHAILGDPEIEGTGAKILNAPSYMYRRLAEKTAGALIKSLTGREDRAFTDEIEARFYAGFLNKRIRG